MLLENNIFYPPYIRFQDPPFFVKAMITAKQFYAIPDVTYCYRAGHQHIDWSQKRTSHLLQGLTDDLRYAKENSLADLHWLTIRRLFSEYKNAINKNSGDEKINLLLQEFQNQIDIKLLLSTKVNVFTELQNVPIKKNNIFKRIKKAFKILFTKGPIALLKAIKNKCKK